MSCISSARSTIRVKRLGDKSEWIFRLRERPGLGEGLQCLAKGSRIIGRKADPMLDDYTLDKTSVWMGTSTKTVGEFARYTEGMENPDSDCPAHRDFGVGFIDSDFFVAYFTPGGKVIPIEELAIEVGTSSMEAHRAVLARCREMGITEGNALYYYCNCTFHEEQPGRLYNELHFIGTFDDPFTLP